MDPSSTVMSDHIHMLEKRLRSLEKEDSDPSADMGCCEYMAWWIYDIIRTIPFFSIFAIIPTAIGVFCIWTTWGSVMEVLTFVVEKDSHTDFMIIEVTKGMKYVVLLFFAVNIVAVLAAIPATGALREALFGTKSDKAFWLCLRCLVGQFVMLVVLIVLFVAFLCSFVAIFFAVPASAFLEIAAGACKAGPASVTEVSEALVASNIVNELTVKHSFDKFCASNYSRDAMQVQYFAIGVVFLAVGQAWQMTMHTNAYEMEMMQADVAETKAYAGAELDQERKEHQEGLREI